MNELAASTLSVLNKYDVPIGSGFLVTADMAITCAHVLSHTGKSSELEAGIEVKFPFLSLQKKYRAQIVYWNKEEDIAGLKLVDVLPPEVKPVSWFEDNPLGCAFITYGFPVDHNHGVYAQGKLVGRISSGLLQMEDTKAQGIRIQRGFSGAAVWNEEKQSVMGMVVLAKDDKMEKMAFCIPAQKLLAIWPELSVHPACPYRELFAFQEEDADFFFGRTSFVERLHSAVNNRRLTAVLGASGSGKSSVVFAGLIPLLRKDSSWVILNLRPGQRPFEALAAAVVPFLEPDLTELEQIRDAKILSEIISQKVQAFSDVTTRLIKKNPTCKRVLLYIDQFEELYTSGINSVERNQFINTLLAAIHEDTRLSLLVTLRADFLEHALAYRPFADALQDAQLNLGPMTLDELRDVIEKPAEKQKVKFEEGLTDLILQHIENNPGALPLLEFALTQLWSRQEKRMLTLKDYQEIGGVEKALSQYADTAFSQLGMEELELAHRVFTQLISPGAGAIETRRLALRSEIKEAYEPVIEDFIQRRLLVTDRTSIGQETVEIVHEALIHGCQTLHSWIEKDREFLAWLAQFRVALQQWIANERKESALLRGLNLSNAEKWLEQRPDDLNQDERLFILLSAEQLKREQAERIRKRNWTISGAILSITTIISVLIVAYYLAQNGERVAHTREIAAQSEVLSNTYPQLSVLLAIEAMGMTSPYLPSAEQALRDGLGKINGIGLSQHEKPVNSLAFSPDARWLATSTLDGTTRLWDLTSNIPSIQSRALKASAEPISVIAFSPDKRWLATGTTNGTTYLWNMNDLSANPIVLSGHERGNSVTVLAFSPDHHWLATGSRDTTVLLWDLQAQDMAASSKWLDGPQNPISRLTFSPDGRWLAGQDIDSSWLWDVTQLENEPISLGVEDQNNNITSFAFSPDSRSFALGGRDSIVRLWDLSAGPQLSTSLQRLSGHKNEINTLVFSQDGRWLATGSSDATIRIWDLDATNIEATFNELHGHKGPVVTLAFSGNGNWLASSGWDTGTYLWDLRRLAANANTDLTAVVLRGSTGYANVLTFSPDDRWLARLGSTNEAWLWDLTASDLSANPVVLPDIKNASFTFSPDGHWLATASNSPSITARLWDMTRPDPSASNNILAGHTGGITSAATSPNGDWLATGSFDSTVRLWNMRDLSGPSIPLTGHTGGINVLAFSAQGDALATSGSDQTICLWSIPPVGSSSRPELERCFSGHTGPIITLDFSFDGRWLTDGNHLWDLNMSDPSTNPRVLPGIGWILVARFSRDGHWLARGSLDGTAQLWNMKDLSEPILLTGHIARVIAVEFSPDRHWLATGSWDGRVRLWDLTSDNPSLDPIVLPRGASVTSLLISPSGHWLAVGGNDKNIYLWDLTSEKSLSNPIDKLIGHAEDINTLAFSPDEQWLASGSLDNTVRLWKLTSEENSENSIVLRGHTNKITSLVFSSDNEWLISGSLDHTARYWNMSIDHVLEMACKVVGRNLSQSEWLQYFPDKDYHRTCPEWPDGP